MAELDLAELRRRYELPAAADNSEWTWINIGDLRSMLGRLEAAEAVLHNSGMTHSAQCWRWHLGCAVRRVEEMGQQGRQVRERVAAWAETHDHEPYCLMSEECDEREDTPIEEWHCSCGFESVVAALNDAVAAYKEPK